MQYLTSLRGIASCIVMVFHLGYYFKESTTLPILQWIFSYGYLGVDFFFILSGFILTYNYKDIFEEKLSVSDLRIFFIKRFARIYPLHLFVLFCFLIIPLAHYVTNRSINYSLYGGESLLAKALLIDLWFVGQSFWDSWNTPSWTISGEFFAYLLFPFICFSISLNKYFPLFFYITSILIITCSYGSLGSSSIGDNISELGLLRCVCEFICGMCVCVLHKNESFSKWVKGKVLLIFSILSLMLSMYFIDGNYVYIPLAFSLLLLSIVNFRGRIHLVLENRYLVTLGEISYSIYLSHMVILSLYMMLFIKSANELNLFGAIVYMALTVIFSFFTYKYIEVPMRLWISSRYAKA